MDEPGPDPRRLQLLQGLGKQAHLLVGKGLIQGVSVGQVGIYAVYLQVGQAPQRLHQMRQLLAGLHAKAPQARVYFNVYPHPLSLPGRLLIQGPGQRVLIHRGHQVVCHKSGDAAVGDAPQHQYEILQPRLPQLQSLAELAGGKAVDAALIAHEQGRPDQSVAVAVGLGCVHNVNIGANVAADALNVALHLSQVHRHHGIGVFQTVRHAALSLPLISAAPE